MMMKTLIVATGLALGFAGVAMAQPTEAECAARAEQRVERHAERLASELQLTDAQTLEVKAILAEQGAAQRELHQRYRTERKALREQGDARMGQVLSAEQRTKLDALRAERKEHGRGKRHGRHRHGSDKAD